MKLIQKIFWKLRSEKKPLKFILSRFLWMTGTCRFFLIKGSGYSLRFYPTALSCGLWQDSSSRGEDEEFIIDYLKEGDLVIDVGANIGALAILSAVRVGDKGKVFAFEAHPKIFKFMNKNVKLNRLTNLSTYNVALGNEISTLYFSNNKLDDMNSVVNINDKNALTIKVDKLDNLINLKSSVALVKLDVEGYEKFVLEGSYELLQKTDCLFFESSEDHFQRYGYSSRDLFRLICEHGFGIYRINSFKTLSSIDANHVSYVGENLIAIKNVNDFISRSGYKIDKT